MKRKNIIIVFIVVICIALVGVIYTVGGQYSYETLIKQCRNIDSSIQNARISERDFSFNLIIGTNGIIAKEKVETIVSEVKSLLLKEENLNKILRKYKDNEYKPEINIIINFNNDASNDLLYSARYYKEPDRTDIVDNYQTWTVLDYNN